MYMTKTIITSECEFCKYGTVDDTNKVRVMVHCGYKNKDYFYGQCVPCENMEKKLNRNQEDV